MRRPNRAEVRVLVAVVLLLGLALYVFNPAFSGSKSAAADTGQPTATNVKVTQVGENNTTLWPYTSRHRTFGSLTLPMTALVEGSPENVTAHLYSTNPRYEQRIQGDRPGAGPYLKPLYRDKFERWQETSGAVRYTYVQHEKSGRWVSSTQQVHQGAYFGRRVHLRLYGVNTENGEWTAIQAHSEHWDWFRLRHTVGSLTDAQHQLELELRLSGVQNVRKRPVRNGGVLDFNGWMTVFELDPVDTDRPMSIAFGAVFASVMLVGQTEFRSRIENTELDRLLTELKSYNAAFLVPLVLIPIAIRILAIASELQFQGLSPKVIAGVLYPVLALGVPIAAAHLRPNERPDVVFALAFAALGVGYLLDYAYVGVEVLPIHVVVHRFVTLLAVALLAAGDADDGWPTTRVGAALWVFCLVWPLADAI